MAFEALLGRVVTLRVCRLSPQGAYLLLDTKDARPGGPTILLPRSEVGVGTKDGDELEVFVYLDSDDRPIATCRRPKLLLGEVAFLAVTDVTRIGAFVNWGLSKELLVPHAEQTVDVEVGERYAIGLYLDDTGRLAGTMRVTEMLQSAGGFGVDEWVQGEAWRKAPDLGVFVIVERRFVGLVPPHEPNSLVRGEAARFRIAAVLPDGKIELSLRGHAHEELENDVRRILDTIARPGSPKVGDRSNPEQIRALFGLSKKAFKRAAGHLLKQRIVDIDSEGCLALRPKPPTRPRA